jgi:hypothetical protein
MRLFVPTMEAEVTDFSPDGQVRYGSEGWSHPTLQETRAIIHAARHEIEALEELIATLDRPLSGRAGTS